MGAVLLTPARLTAPLDTDAAKAVSRTIPLLAIRHGETTLMRDRVEHPPASACSTGGSFVYFIQAESGGPVKIGHSVDPGQRLSQLQSSSPYKLVIRAVIPGDRAKEREFHHLFHKQRIRGEWFEPCPLMTKLGRVVCGDEPMPTSNGYVEFSSRSQTSSGMERLKSALDFAQQREQHRGAGYPFKIGKSSRSRPKGP